MEVYRKHFKKKLLRSITYADLRNFRSVRLDTPTRTEFDEHGKPVGQRSITTVNRELAYLRRMFNIAVEEGWLIKSPFGRGRSLFSIAAEQKRERILTREEEVLLLAACDAPKRKHLKAIVICALDTGMRKGEILIKGWSDIDLDANSITVRSENTKTERQRTIHMTARLTIEIERLWEEVEPGYCEVDEETGDVKTIFKIRSVKRSFDAVRKAVGIPELRFHDLRHSAATRLVRRHIPLPEVGKLLGHQQPSTTWRYVNVDVETARRAAEALDSFHAEPVVTQEVAEEETVN